MRPDGCGHTTPVPPIGGVADPVRPAARPAPTGTGPRRGWPDGSRPATDAAASPAAPSPPSSATSTTSDPGPTDPPPRHNLLCLCRRHHRIKQRPGWQVTLTPDGIATWTDPTGRIRTTHPVDALHPLILTDPRPTPGDPRSTTATATSRARTLIPDGPHSELEFHLEHHTAPPDPATRPTPVTLWRDHHGRHRTDLQPASGPAPILIDHAGHRPRQHRPTRTRRHDDDPPPF